MFVKVQHTVCIPFLIKYLQTNFFFNIYSPTLFASVFPLFFFAFVGALLCFLPHYCYQLSISREALNWQCRYLCMQLLRICVHPCVCVCVFVCKMGTQWRSRDTLRLLVSNSIQAFAFHTDAHLENMARTQSKYSFSERSASFEPNTFESNFKAFFSHSLTSHIHVTDRQ